MMPEKILPISENSDKWPIIQEERQAINKEKQKLENIENDEYLKKKTKATYTFFMLVPIVAVVLAFIVAATGIPYGNLISQVVIIISVFVMNYARLRKICDSNLIISGTVRQTIIMVGMGSIFMMLLMILPPIRLLINLMGNAGSIVATAMGIIGLYIVNNIFGDLIDGKNYDCNYILGWNTIKDFKKPTNIMFIVSGLILGLGFVMAFYMK
jgi:cation transport ATPase